MTLMILRISAFLLLLFSVLFMPLWVSVLLALSGMIYFAIFWEATFLFLLSDLLYGAKEAEFHGIIFLSFIASIIILLIVEFLKKKTNFSK